MQEFADATMTDSSPDIDFHAIRVREGSKAEGFEQLAVELFSRSVSTSTQRLTRVRGAGGDGGVEAYVQISERNIRAVQAKYFKRLQDSQWKQISKSVETALSKHPSISAYHVYVSLDRTPSQVRRWEERVEKWKKLVADNPVEFVWIGASEIESDLKRPENQDLLFYWFGVRSFNEEWMDDHLASALNSLGPRYQPHLHVGSAVGAELGRFVWSAESANLIQQEYVNFAEACVKLLAANSTSDLTGGTNQLQKALRAVLRREYPSYRKSELHDVMQAAEDLRLEVDKLLSAHMDEIPARPGHPNESESVLRSLYRFQSILIEWSHRLASYRNSEKPFALVLGEAGVGKSHLLANCAKEARLMQQPAILLLGEQFLEGRPALTQIGELLNPNVPPLTLLRALNVAGSLAGAPALILIDALNESNHRQLWKTSLQQLSSAVRKFPHLRLVVSCRRDFVEICMPREFRDGTPSDWALIEHEGLGDVQPDLVARYFKNYNITSGQFPPILEEFRNPLFLDTFCQAFEGERIPDGPITLELVMEGRLKRAAEKIHDQIDCDEFYVRKAISSLADRIGKNAGQSLEEEDARKLVEVYSPSIKVSRSLYTHLLSNGLLAEWTSHAPSGEKHVMVRFAFERYSDYFVAKQLLSAMDNDKHRGSRQINRWCAWIDSIDGYLENRGLARALSILIPEKWGTELVDLLPESDFRELLLQDFLDSIPWRSPDSISESTNSILAEARRSLSASSIASALLRVATVSNHPFNANYLHAHLLSLTLAERDLTWTIPIYSLTESAYSSASTLVAWASNAPTGAIDDTQATLLARVLLWFGSSNRVSFRARSALAAIQLLTDRPHVMTELVESFDSVNDPYVVERLYAVACGVAMRQSQGHGLRNLASSVNRHVFDQEQVRPHVLLRDYARTVILLANQRGSLAEDVDIEVSQPPYDSKLPRTVGEARARSIEERPGWRRIAQSVRPEGMGIYGDFGRYVMGSALRSFLSIRRSVRLNADRPMKGYDPRRARRWLLQRIDKLGWDSRIFAEYDESLPDDGKMNDENKVERIGKKYQWIALHELVALLSDHYHIRPDDIDSPSSFEGAWQLDLRDFDPSGNRPDTRLKDLESSHDEIDKGGWRYINEYPCPFDDLELLEKRQSWVESRPVSPSLLLKSRHGDDPRHWLTLGGFWRWTEPRILSIRHGWFGRCKMWMHVRSWLVRADEVDSFVEQISGSSFGGHGCAGVSCRQGWLGEYPHGAPFSELPIWCQLPDDWAQSSRIAHVRTTCDWEEDTPIPSPQVCDALDVSWSAEGTSFVDSNNKIVATNAPLPHRSQSLPCVVSLVDFRRRLEQTGFGVVWGILGERQCWEPETPQEGFEARFSAVYTLRSDDLEGGITVFDRLNERAHG